MRRQPLAPAMPPDPVGTTRSAQPSASAAWRLSFRLIYSFLRLLDPVLRLWWHAFGIGITAELTVRGHHSGRERSVLVGLLLPPRAIGLSVHNLVALANDPVGRTG